MTRGPRLECHCQSPPGILGLTALLDCRTVESCLPNLKEKEEEEVKEGDEGTESCFHLL